MTVKIPTRTDHQNAARYADVANKLRTGERFWNDKVRDLTPDVDSYDTFAVPLINRLRPLLEQVAAVYADLADGSNGAQELADIYRSLVDLRYGGAA